MLEHSLWPVNLKAKSKKYKKPQWKSFHQGLSGQAMSNTPKGETKNHLTDYLSEK
jgi:hypothetical protein